MNKKHGFCSKIFILVLLFTSFLLGCKSGGTKATKEEVNHLTRSSKDNIIKMLEESPVSPIDEKKALTLELISLLET